MLEEEGAPGLNPDLRAQCPMGTTQWDCQQDGDRLGGSLAPKSRQGSGLALGAGGWFTGSSGRFPTDQLTHNTKVTLLLLVKLL